MDFQTWIKGIDGSASLYSFDILPDGSYSEIRLMAVNKQSESMLHMAPNAPEFYPGIPYRNYWMDINFESFVYKCGAKSDPLYSYVNARGLWIKGFYIPIKDFENDNTNKDGVRTVYCLYVIVYSDNVETEAMMQKSSEVANAVMEIGIKLHETQDFYQAMTAASKEIKAFCGAEKCSLYTVDKSTRECLFINENGNSTEFLQKFTSEMGRTPYEVAMAWEEDLALSDCLLLEKLDVVKERDPVWYNSLISHGVNNIILYAVRNNQELVGFIWAANYDTEKRDLIKETLELSTFMLAAMIANHHLVSRLEFQSTVDALTKVLNRNAMNDKIDRFNAKEEALPKSMGIVFADLNGLKVVNDEQGHEAGDKLLKRAAALLKVAFEDYDIYRAGGDEFIVFCDNADKDEISRKVTQLRGLCDNTSDVSFAIGSVYESGEYDITNLIHAADEAMYKDKEEYYKNHPGKLQRKPIFIVDK